MRYPKNVNLQIGEHRKIFLECLGKYFQIILVELGRKDLNDDDEVNSSNPFKIPSDCHWTTLGGVIEFSSNLNIQSKLSPDTKINYVDIDAIDNKEYRIREVKERTVSELSSRARRVLKKGFMVYSLVRPYLNNLAIVEEDREHFIGSTGFAVFKGTKLKNEFLKLLLLSEYVRQRFLEMLSGFNSPTITQEQFVKTPVPFVPKTLQAGIVQFLSDLEKDAIREDHVYFDKEVEEKITSLHGAQLIGSALLNEIVTQEKTLILLRQTILQEAVQGKLTKQDPTDEPATELLKRIKAEKEKLIKAGKLKKEKELPPITESEIPFELPKGWIWCRLGEICIKIGSGSTPRGGKEVYASEGNKFIRSQNVYNEGLVFDSVAYIDEATHKKMEGTKVIANDILLNITGGSIGRCALVPQDFDEANVSQHVTIVRTVSLVVKEFIHQLIISPYFQDYIMATQTGGNREGLAKKNMELMLIPLPPLAEQQRIVAKVQQLQQQLSQLEAQVQQSRQYAQQLLQSVLKEAFEERGED